MSALSDYLAGKSPAPPDLLDRMERAVKAVRNRLLGATAALEAAQVPYAVVGEQAVAAWVARLDDSAVRYSPQIDILLDRSKLEAAKAALARAGFEYQQLQGLDMFIERPAVRSRDAIRVTYARERSSSGDPYVSPDIRQSVDGGEFQVIALEPLVRMKLASFRILDRVNIRDMIDVGLVDESWLARLPSPLAERLRELLDDPEG